MKRFLIVLSMLVLTACGTLPAVQNPVTVQTLAKAESAYGVALALAVGYRNLPLCLTGHPTSYNNYCARRSVIVQLQAADLKVQALLPVARAAVATASLNAASALDLLNQAITAFKAVEANNGVN